MSEALAHVGDRRAALTHFAGELDRTDLEVPRQALEDSSH